MTNRLYALFGAAILSAAPALAQERFDTPEAAAQAMLSAAESHDSTRLSAIIGPQAAAILTSGNPTQDRDEQTEFARLGRAKHEIQISPMNPNRAVLAIGDEDWPFPVPLRRSGGKWSFDASQTPAEMRARRIGSNELDAIEICHGYVEAQQQYAAEDRKHDGMLQYAPRLLSHPGKQDGLYWEGAAQPLIPAGLAHAAWDDLPKGEAKPYHGYYFRVLDSQGPDAAGGAHNYLAQDKMIGGFGLVAWPAEYGLTGIHTFIVNQDGTVYEKEIEPVAGKALPLITRFDPDRSWQPAE